jgi:hypothetical protein
MGQLDRHHILHYRQEWTLRPGAEKLRESRPLVPTLPREVHNEIHANCPPVPLLGYHALARTVKLYRPLMGDTLGSMDNLMFAIEEAADHPRSHPIERDLAELAIQAVDLQRPYIKEGLQHGNTTVEIAA